MPELSRGDIESFSRQIPGCLELATEFGMTLVGFLKADRFNVYSRPDRIL